MDKEILIKKWLDNELSAEEFEAFKALEEYNDFIKLSEASKRFKAEDFDTEKELQVNLEKIKSEKRTKNNWIKSFFKVAAVVLICFGVYQYTTGLDTTISTLASQKTSLELPDQSKVSLNAKSQLTYNKSDWKTERKLNLKGEAYFNVTKGNTFKVITNSGTITVLGTQFNVKQRNNYFEVVCYEGSVKVDYNTVSKVLKPQDIFMVYNNKVIHSENNSTLQPTWITNVSSFKSVPYLEVLKEFERQFNVTIKAENIDKQTLFTGSFEHTNRNNALKSITIPLRLKYKDTNKNTIVLTRE
ncbi:FecR family protein [Lacinutrix salivirga]